MLNSYTANVDVIFEMKFEAASQIDVAVYKLVPPPAAERLHVPQSLCPTERDTLSIDGRQA